MSKSWDVDQVLRETIREEATLEARRIAREEVASLCGLVLRRCQGMTDEALAYGLSSIFGEALADFSGRTKGGEPGSE